ncbi:MAG TPA: hypothetical protein VGG29_02205 [Caulobacteraceae bacterium]|jgi:hypothetical protein
MRRRAFIAMLAAAAAAPALAPGLAFADDARQPLAKAFAFLDAYLGLPPGERNRFYLAYRAYRDKRPAPGVGGTIVAANGARTPVPFDRAGEVMRLPSLGELRSGATFECAGAPFRLGLELRLAGAPAARIDPAAVVAGLAQANAAIHKLAGVLAMAAPRLTAAYFPDAVAGQVVLADGRAAPLPVTTAPVVGPVPYFEPASAAGARAVVLARAPSRVLLGGHPRKA